MATMRLPKAIIEQQKKIAEFDANAKAPAPTVEQPPRVEAPTPPVTTTVQPPAVVVDRTAELDEARRLAAAAEGRAAELAAQNAALAQQLQSARPAEPPPVVDEARALDVLGPDALSVVRDIVRAETAPVVQKLDQQQQVIQPIAEDANTAFLRFQGSVQAKLGTASWQWLQQHPSFNSYMNAVENGAPRGEALTAAIQARDADRTAALYAQFARSIGITITGLSEPPPTAAPAAVTVTPLDQREAPSGASAAAVTAPSGTAKSFTSKEVKQFYADLAKAKANAATWTPTVKADFESREREILQAQAAGLIRG